MTDWSQFVAYECRHPRCQSNCINRVDSPPAQMKQCCDCWRATDDELPSLTHHLPASYRGSGRATSSLD